MGFCVYVPLPPLRGQHTVLCHPRWLPTSGLTEFAVCWGGAGFEPRTTDLQSGALPFCSQVRYQFAVRCATNLQSGALPICSQVRYQFAVRCATNLQSGALPIFSQVRYQAVRCATSSPFNTVLRKPINSCTRNLFNVYFQRWARATFFGVRNRNSAT